jgi:hypothetical protein
MWSPRLPTNLTKTSYVACLWTTRAGRAADIMTQRNDGGNPVRLAFLNIFRVALPPMRQLDDFAARNRR